MKKNYAMRIAALVLMCTIITACFAGTTFAKYTSSGSGTGDLKAALWSIKVGDQEIANKEGTVATFAAFENATVYPGYSQTKELTITNGSEVAADVTVKVELVGNAIDNLKINYPTGFENGVYTVTIPAGKDADISGIAVEWPYFTNEADDIEDTADGIDASEAQVKVTVNAVQATS